LDAAVQVLFENRWQAKKVRWLTIALAVWCIGWLYWAWDTLHAYGVEPADGGLLKPFSERLQMAVIIAVLGAFPVAGMVFYSTLYITKVERDGATVALTTLGVFGSTVHRYDAAAFTQGRQYEGWMSARTKVHAPWLALRVAGRRIPFVVDLQAEVIKIGALEALGQPERRKA
jgi:hypothetical protein